MVCQITNQLLLFAICVLSINKYNWSQNHSQYWHCYMIRRRSVTCSEIPGCSLAEITFTGTSSTFPPSLALSPPSFSPGTLWGPPFSLGLLSFFCLSCVPLDCRIFSPNLKVKISSESILIEFDSTTTGKTWMGVGNDLILCRRTIPFCKQKA